MTSNNESEPVRRKSSATHSRQRNTQAGALSKRHRICSPRRRECGIFALWGAGAVDRNSTLTPFSSPSHEAINHQEGVQWLLPRNLQRSPPRSRPRRNPRRRNRQRRKPRQKRPRRKKPRRKKPQRSPPPSANPTLH